MYLHYEILQYVSFYTMLCVISQKSPSALGSYTENDLEIYNLINISQ